MENKLPWWAFVIPAVMSLIALADLPYGYYQLLRIVVSACAGWIAYSCYREHKPYGVAVFVTIAVIFNPFVKIHMEREIHAISNVITALFLIIALLVQSRIKPKPDSVT